MFKKNCEKKREKERERKLESIFSSRNTESYPHEYIFTDVKKKRKFYYQESNPDLPRESRLH